MKAKGLIFRISQICEKHNIDSSSVNVKFDDEDIDAIFEYDSKTNTIILHKRNFLKENE